MPTYEYVCQQCRHAFEQFQSMRDEPLKKCPQCKKQGLKRLIGGGAGLIFKGSGFHATDYRKPAPKPAAAPAASGGTAASAPAKAGAH